MTDSQKDQAAGWSRPAEVAEWLASRLTEVGMPLNARLPGDRDDETIDAWLFSTVYQGNHVTVALAPNGERFLICEWVQTGTWHDFMFALPALVVSGDFRSDFELFAEQVPDEPWVLDMVPESPDFVELPDTYNPYQLNPADWRSGCCRLPEPDES